ncbi:O-methyltransferase [Ascidiimonas sp. W6]|uniref:O-methyltransferase n=1 Tax=Ascidiimonas meishanensis TaxID=3128903 RepID=UPI0030ED2054
MNLIVSYSKFLVRSVNQHGIHSPFIYDLVTKCFYDAKEHEDYKRLKAYRLDLLNSKEVIHVTDYGAGSRIFKSPERKIRKVALNAGISLRKAKLLHRLTSYLDCKNALELGTSVGLGSVAIATANDKIKLTTIEGCPETSSIAIKQLQKYHITNVQVLNKTFEEFLITPQLPVFDLIYIDGNHRKEPTLTYFRKLLNNVHNNSVMILDDIHWSNEMEEAWSEIKKHQKVKVSIDIFKWGILFFREEQVKEHFTIRV